ncbi:MPN domain-containing protein-like [Montipora capricornis]|uniref:MPN domain-containing protein-like n=1 Tax=Montipora capricornis TaxID=246305 RepID=UPI0035F1EC50
MADKKMNVFEQHIKELSVPEKRETEKGRAKRDYTEALRIFKEIGFSAGERNACGNLGNAYHSLGNFKKAKKYLKQQLSIGKKVGNRAWESKAYGNLGSAYFSLGNFKEAIKYHEQDISIAKEVSSSQETPPASKREANISPSVSQPMPLSLHKSPPRKTSSSHGDTQDVSLASPSSSAFSSSFHSPPPSTSQPMRSPNSTGQKISGSSTTGSSSSLPAEVKRPVKVPHSSGRGRKPNIGYIHPPPQAQLPQKSSLPFSPTSVTPSSSKSSGSLRSPVEISRPLSSPPASGGRKRPAVRSRQSIKYSMLTADSDPHTLVELVNFFSLGKVQPFSIDISTNCLLLMDYHCHLTSSEVVGYLAGKFDSQTDHMKIVQAFPCRCRFADKENAPKVEEEIRNAISQRGLVLVGWYHSHPSYQPDPSLQDIQNQLKYQSILQQDNAPYGPCLGIIVSPYDSYRPSKESTIRAFWVQASSDSHKLGMPMLMNTTSHQDQFLTQDLLNELRWMWSFYKGSPDTINFHNMWHGNQTYLDKVKSSLIKKFPTDQTDGRFLEFINTLLT